MKIQHLPKWIALPALLCLAPLSCNPPEDVDEKTLEDVTPREIVVSDLSELAGTHWRLVDFFGDVMPDDAGATLSFDLDGRISGGASVNRFNGPIELTDDGIQTGPFASTRMAGPPDAMEREQKYLAALAAIKSIHKIGDDRLVIQIDGQDLPLRYTAMDAD